MLGAGMVIFGVTLVCALTNLKCSRCGWPEKPILPTVRTLSALVSTPAKMMPLPVEYHLDAVEALVEIELPPGAAELAVGRELEADLLLLLDDLLDLAVLDLAERLGALISPFGVLGARLLQRRRAQQAADVIGAERGFAAFHGHCATLLRVPDAVQRKRVTGLRGWRAADDTGSLGVISWRCPRAFTSPKPLRRSRPPRASSPTAAPRSARCLPRSRRSRIAGSAPVAPAARTSTPRRCGA